MDSVNGFLCKEILQKCKAFENGSPFVLNSKGSIDFGYITEEMNLPPAPIRIAEGNERYGLVHMEIRHKDQIRDNGFISVLDFVEYVSQHFDCIRQGNNDSCLLEVSGGKHNETLFVRLFQEEGYWKVISGGVFNLRYSKKKKDIYSGSDNRPPQPATDGEGLSSL